MTIHSGRCLCGALCYEALQQPIRVTICHCRFCQRATGAAYMVEPIFLRPDIKLTKGEPTIYSLPSGGSGKTVHVHFCPTCGTKLWLGFERFPTVFGVYAGTFDEPDWFVIGPDNTKQIFIDVARRDSILMPDIDAYGQHAMLNDGTPTQAFRVDQPRAVGAR